MTIDESIKWIMEILSTEIKSPERRDALESLIIGLIDQAKAEKTMEILNLITKK